MLKSALRCFTIPTNRQSLRLFSLTPFKSLKRIDKKEDPKTKTITIEGKYLESEQVFGNKVLKLDTERDNDQQTKSNSLNEKFGCVENDYTKPCCLCELEKKQIFVQYNDVLVLRQFLTDDGNVLSRKITNLCRKQHRKVKVLAKQAQQAGLIMNLQPNLLNGSKPSIDPHSRSEHLKWNTYFDDYEKLVRTKKFL
jgi:ribosomal protein S18